MGKDRGEISKEVTGFKTIPYEAQDIQRAKLVEPWETTLVQESGRLTRYEPDPNIVYEIRLAAGEATVRIGESSDRRLWLVSGQEQGDGAQAFDVREEMLKAEGKVRYTVGRNPESKIRIGESPHVSKDHVIIEFFTEVYLSGPVIKFTVEGRGQNGTEMVEALNPLKSGNQELGPQFGDLDR